MAKVIEPEDVFSQREIRRLLRWIAIYNNPMKPAIILAVVSFVGAIAVIIALVQLEVPLPRTPEGGIQGQLFLVSCGVGVATFFLSPILAILVFASFDKRYFKRAGVSEDHYVSGLMDEAKHEAAIRFVHEMPDGQNPNMFHFPEEQRKDALEAYQSAFLKKCASEERRLRFKAYVARRFGLQIPLTKRES